MKKRIVSIVICLCLAIAMLQTLELSFTATAATARVLKCDCGASTGSTAVGTVTHYSWCELFCNCTYHTESASSHSEATCPCFSCCTHGKNEEWRKCTINNSLTTTATAFDGKSYTVKGVVTHTNVCMKFKQKCSGTATGCTTTGGTTTHGLGCPMYDNTVSGGFRNPYICPNCGWLFGDHWRYCPNDKNGYKASWNTAIYMPGAYTNSNTAPYYQTLSVSNIDTWYSNYGITSSDVTVIKNANNAIPSGHTNKDKVHYRKIVDTQFTAPQGGNDILIPYNSIVIIDLNGNSIWSHGKGPAITNFGTLIIIDSRPNTVHKGKLEDRGYYYFDDEAGKYFHSVRNAEDAVWVQTPNAAETSETTYVYGGVIYGGRTTRNNTHGIKKDTDTTSSTTVVGGGKTYDELMKAYTDGYSSNADKMYFTYLVENSEVGGRYGFGGGGIHNEGTVVMNGGTIAGCESTEGYGAAVYSTGAGASFTMNGGSIRYNFGDSIVAADNNAKTIINSGDIYRNVGIGNGAIRGFSNGSNKPTVTIGQTTDTNTYNQAILNLIPEANNDAFVAGKGKLANTILTNTSKIEVPLIAYNRALSDIVSGGNGGAIYAHNINLNVNAAIIVGNWAHYRAGGIDIFEEGTVTLSGNIIVKNNYCEYKGGGISVRNPSANSTKLKLTINSDTVQVIGNKAGYGGGIFVSYGDVDLNGAIVKDNESVGYYISTNNYNALSYNVEVVEDSNDDGVVDINTRGTDLKITSSKCFGYPELRSDANTVSGYRTTQAIQFNGKVNDVSFAPRIPKVNNYSTKVQGTTTYITECKSLCTVQRGGGGIYIQGDSDTNVIIQGKTKFEGNYAVTHGGGLYLSDGTVEIKKGPVIDNVEYPLFTKNYIYGVADAELGAVQRKIDISYKGSIDDNNKYSGDKNGLTNSDGGGMYVTNGKVTMQGGTFSTNKVLSGAGDGGGIYVSGKEYDYVFTMNGGYFYNNSNVDDQGGAIHSDGNMKITAGEIYNNISCDNGGGVYISAGNFDMTGGKIYGNTAKTYIGGGVYVHEGDFNMSGGEIYGNQVLTRNGGGVYIRNGNFTMTSGKIYQNTALNTQAAKTKADDVGTQFGSGGGVCIQNGTVTITGDSRIYENQAKFKGGAIYQFASARYSDKGTRNLTIGTNDKNAAQPQITNNSVAMTISGEYKLGGGAICVEGGGSKLTINNATISQNTLSGERADGGAILVLEGTTDPSDTTSEQAIKGTSTVVINNVEAFENKSLTDHGGFLAVQNGTVTVDDGNIYNNIACDNAGAIYVGGGTVNLDSDKDGNLEIHDNEAHNYIAGAIEVDNGIINMYGGNVYNNKIPVTLSAYSQGQGHGGAFAIRTGTFNMYGGAIYNNQTGSYGDGGAIAILNEGVANVYGGKIGVKPDGTAAGNVAKNNGGAIYVRSGNIYIGKNGCDGLAENSNHNNIAHTDSKCGHPIIENNTAVNGGGLYSQGGTTTFYCGEMKSNIASNKGGGMYVEGGTVTINKGTVTGNKAAQEYYGDSLYMAGGTVTYTEENTFRNDNDTSTGVVVAGGTLEKTNAIASLVSVYFKDRETGQTELAFKVPADVEINLPDGNDIFGAYPDRTFIGWQYPDVGNFVRNSDEYYPRGAEITTEDNSRYVQGASANTMTLYGVWARDVNTISYYSTHKENSGITTNDAYETEYRYDTAKTITLPTPILAGYNFTGWTMQQGSDCKTNCNANWGISVNGDAKNAGDKLNTSGKFGNIHFVANWSTTIQYKAVYDDGVGLTEGTNGGSVQVQNASTTYEDITINKQTSSANGAVATPAANYTFIGWYTDAACTNRVSTDATYVPTTNDSGYYNNLTYYAKFALEYKDLTIRTSGADEEQTFVFTVQGTSGYAANVEMQVYVIGGNSYTTIKHIPAGEYRIYENNVSNSHQGDKWTWRYTDTEVQNAKVDGSKTNNTNESAVDTVTFNYNNSKMFANWLSGLSHKFIG